MIRNWMLTEEQKNIGSFYGIDGIDFRYRGDWCDPAISLKGDYTEISCYYLENYIYDVVRENFLEKGVDFDSLAMDEQDEELCKYAGNNKNEIIATLKDIISEVKKDDFNKYVQLVKEGKRIPDELWNMELEIEANAKYYGELFINIFGEKYEYTGDNTEK